MSPFITTLPETLKQVFSQPPILEFMRTLGQHLLQQHLTPTISHQIPVGIIMPTLNTPSTKPTAPLFPLGQCVATPNALETLAAHGIQPLHLLQRHVTGDWGDLDPEDVESNHDALQHRLRLFSSYHLTPHVTIWVITEADRSVTTLLLPSEY